MLMRSIREKAETANPGSTFDVRKKRSRIIHQVGVNKKF
jgi:hypothetical protein